MKRVSFFHIGWLLILCSPVLQGCDWGPTPGRVIEEKFKKKGDLKIVLRRYNEGGWGNTANGQHYEALCKSKLVHKSLPSGEKPFTQMYRVQDYWLKELPIDQITVLNEQIGYGVLGTTFFGTLDGCKSKFNWYLHYLPNEFSQLINSNFIVSEQPFIVNIKFTLPSTFEFNINPYYVNGDKKIILRTTDEIYPWNTYLEGTNADVNIQHELSQ